MAKQEKVFSFDDLNKKMKEVSDFGSIMSENEISTIDHFIHSGNYLLNAALTGSLKRGYPGNRSVAFAGPSGVGKTYLLLNGIRRAQQEEGYYTVFFDSENAVDVDLMKKFGIDTSMVRYEPVNTVQEFRHISTVITEELLEAKKKGMQIPKILFVLDSAGNLATMKEVEDAKSGSEKSDMTRSKILKSIFRILMTRLGILKIPFWFSNHVYQTQDLFSKTIQGGGCVVPGTEIIMSDRSLKRIEDIKTGDYVMTLTGEREVTNTFEFEKETYEVEFEDGSTLTVSEDHRFYKGEEELDWAIEEGWINVKDLKEGDEISSLG